MPPTPNYSPKTWKWVLPARELRARQLEPVSAHGSDYIRWKPGTYGEALYGVGSSFEIRKRDAKRLAWWVTALESRDTRFTMVNHESETKV